MRFLLAATWGLIVLAGLIGWGSLLGRLFRRGQTLPLGLSGAIGFSFGVAIGGVLGVFHLILPATVIAFIVLGLPLLMFRRSSAEKIPNHQSSRILFAILIPLLACRYLSCVHQTDFQPLDDVPAYLVYPVKMLQTGQFAADPYSDRRMTGLGGQQWSQCLVIAPFDPSVINLFDHGIALLLLLLICWEWLISIGMSRAFATTVLLVLTATYPNYVNTASFVTISALLLAIFVLLLDGAPDFRHAILLALLVSAICSLKTTVIPLVGTILAIHFVMQSVAAKSIRPILLGCIVAGITLLLLFPWMHSMHQSSNTYLPPLLGRGNSMLESMVGTMPPSIRRLLMCLCAACLACGIFIILSLRNNALHRRWMLTAAIFPLATAPVIFLITELTGGLGWMRYAQPFIYGWIALPMTACWIASTSNRWMQRWLARLATLAIAAAAIGQSIGWARAQNPHGTTFSDRASGPAKAIIEQCGQIADGLNWKPIFTAADLQQTEAMQAAVPSGAVILERTDLPYLFDFRRNTIFIDDHPGLVYPPPGLPEEPAPSALRDFLLAHGVSYVAYSYGDEANFSHANAILEKTQKAWDRTVIRHTFGVQDALAELMKTQRIVYDDRTNAVIDLSAKKQ